MYVENRNNIPDYDHPFNVTIINDNSAMPRRSQIVPDKVNYLCVFVGGKGRDPSDILYLAKTIKFE